MKLLIVVSIISLLALPALAGDCGSCCVDGFECKCACPLAKQANTCRALGSEASLISIALCRDCGNNVEQDLGKI